jgi:uncharacterized protein DUF5937
VAIRFVLPEQESESVAFSYSPVVEAVLSLHVLVAPKHHPLQRAWVRRMRRLDPRLRAEIQAFRFAYVGHFPGFLFPRPDEEFLEFEQELAFLHDLEPETPGHGKAHCSSATTCASTSCASAAGSARRARRSQR